MEKSILPVEEVPQAREHDGDTSDTSNKARGTRRFTRVDYHPTIVFRYIFAPNYAWIAYSFTNLATCRQVFSLWTL